MPKVDDRIGPYQLIKKIGKGGFGEVWLAKNVTALVSRNPQVALKIPHDEDVDLEAVKQEAAIWLAASGHDNVLPFIEANIYEDQVVIVSEYAPDGSLYGWLKPHGGRAPSVEKAIELISGILNGLAHLHARNIIHRDLKPDNILLQGSTPRITDFGISRIFKTTTQRTMIVGTPVYMAPEAFDGERNQQTDVWSVGVMLYQLLTGRLPFSGETYGEVMKSVFESEPHPLPASVPQWLQQVVAKAMAKKPEARYATATEMLSALQSSVYGMPPPVQMLSGDSEETRYNKSRHQIKIPLSNLAASQTEFISHLVSRPEKASHTLLIGISITLALLAVFVIWAANKTQKSDNGSDVVISSGLVTTPDPTITNAVPVVRQSVDAVRTQLASPTPKLAPVPTQKQEFFNQVRPVILPTPKATPTQTNKEGLISTEVSVPKSTAPPIPSPTLKPTPTFDATPTPKLETQRVSGGVLTGRAIRKMQPPYPAIAKAARAQGAVQVAVTISEEGRVISAEAVGGHPLLHEAAVQAARQWTFQPTEVFGQPVKVKGIITFNFTLQ